MPATTHRIRVGLALAAACILSGCGGGKEESVPLPAPAPKPPAEVGPSVTTPSTGAAPGAPTTDAGAPPPTGQGTPPPAPTGPEDMFRGMTPKQIEDFKKNSTPETHDMNIGRIMDAAEGFYKEYGRPAASQDQLVKAGYLPSVLPAPKGKKYVFNPKTTDVTVENK